MQIPACILKRSLNALEEQASAKVNICHDGMEIAFWYIAFWSVNRTTASCLPAEGNCKQTDTASGKLCSCTYQVTSLFDSWKALHRTQV